MKILNWSFLALSVFLLTGCVGTETKYLHSQHFRRTDPMPDGYLEGFSSDSHIYIHYTLSSCRAERVKAVSKSYWASKPFGSDEWTIYRKSPPKALEEQRLIPLRIVAIPPDPSLTRRKWIEDYATIIETEGLALPVLFVSEKKQRLMPDFFLIEKKNPTHKCGYTYCWREPTGSYQDNTARVLFIWLYPVAMTVDFFVEPITELIDI